MQTRQPEPIAGRWPGRRWVVARARLVLDALKHLVRGLGTACLAVAVLIWLIAVAVACLVGVGVLLMPSALRAVRVVANRERARLSRWGPTIVQLEAVPVRLRAAVADPLLRRESGWLLTHATLGFAISLLGLSAAANAVRDTTFPLWWWLLPPNEASPSIGLWLVRDLPGALWVSLLGVGWFIVAVGLLPGLAQAQARPGRRLLTPPAGIDLSLRIAELTSTRAAALDAHATELRRIERSLHDGTQNRLVAVTVLLGAARRAMSKDPSRADIILERAQDAAEQALAELRTVARGILPPVLADRGLAGALAGLASTCAVPCRVEVDVPGRCAASVEATAYFVVAEALTNVSKHSHAGHATVTVTRDGDRLRLRVHDDGRGGVDERAGSGVDGIRRRVEAHDGRLTLTSPPGGPTTVEVDLPCGL
jgi:signal transduction histidine kinase